MSDEQKRLLESDGTLPDELADFPITEPITLDPKQSPPPFGSGTEPKKACENCVAWDPNHEMIAKAPDLGMCMAQPVVHFTLPNGETDGIHRLTYKDRWCELHKFAHQKPSALLRFLLWIGGPWR